MAIKTVGIIGVGAMGRPMGGHLLKAGYAVVGCDLDENARRRAGEQGLRMLASPGDVARESDLVIVVVGFDAQVEAVMYGEGGIMGAARPGLTVGIGATIAPSYARGLAERVAGSGVALIDMPLMRSETAARDGTMLIMVGCDAPTFEACRPVLDTFATDIFHLGAFGNGQVGKMVNNIILWACMAANDEGLRFGEGLGVDQEALRAALVRSSAANFSLSERAEERPTPWAEKDLLIAQQESDRIRFSIPLAGHVKEIIKAMKVRRGYPTPTP